MDGVLGITGVAVLLHLLFRFGKKEDENENEGEDESEYEDE